MYVLAFLHDLSGQFCDVRGRLEVFAELDAFPFTLLHVKAAVGFRSAVITGEKECLNAGSSSTERTER